MAGRMQSMMESNDIRALVGNINALARECSHKRTRTLMRGHAWKIVRGNSEMRAEALQTSRSKSFRTTADMLIWNASSNGRILEPLQHSKYDTVEVQKRSDRSDLKKNGREELAPAGNQTIRDRFENFSISATIQSINNDNARTTGILRDVTDEELFEALLLIKMKKAVLSDHFETIGSAAQAARREKTRPPTETEEVDEDKAEKS